MANPRLVTTNWSQRALLFLFAAVAIAINVSMWYDEISRYVLTPLTLFILVIVAANWRTTCVGLPREWHDYR
jgi:hypothetical protein